MHLAILPPFSASTALLPVSQTANNIYYRYMYNTNSCLTVSVTKAFISLGTLEGIHVWSSGNCLRVVLISFCRILSTHSHVILVCAAAKIT